MGESFVGFGTAHVEVAVDLVRFDVFIRAGVAVIHYVERAYGVDWGNSMDRKAESAIWADAANNYTIHLYSK